MQYFTLPNSDLEISRVILGTWPLGGDFWGPYDKGKAVETIEFSLDQGINTIDTAPIYGQGQAEKIIGSIVKKRREQVIIATKCGLDLQKHGVVDLSPSFIKKDLEQSLTRLQTDYIDLYQCHWPDPNTPLEKTMEALLKLKEQGKIRYLGLSNFSNEQFLEALQYASITSFQPHYSLLHRNLEKDILKTCLQNNIPILSYGSLGGGLLTGKYKERPSFSKKDARSFFYYFFKEPYWEKIENLIKVLEKIAIDKKAEPGQIALAWLLAQKQVGAVIVGAKTPAQIEMNLKSPNYFLTDQDLQDLDLASRNVYQNKDKN